MRTHKALVAVSISLVVILAAVGVYGQQRKAGRPALSPADWIEIYQLYGRYTHLIDNGEEKGHAYAKLWTEDAIFEFGGNKHQGHDALAAVAMYGIQDPPILRPAHYAFNIVIDPSPGGAVGKAYLVMMAANKPGEAHTVTTRGIYEDQFEKTPDGWRFAYRKFTPAAFSTEGMTSVGRIPPGPVLDAR